MNGNMDAQSGPPFRRYLNGPFMNSLKLAPSSPHPPISSSSGSSSPHHDDVDSPPHPLPPNSVESPASYAYSSRSDDDAPTSPPSGHFGSKRRKQHKPIRCDGLKGDGMLDSDSGVHEDVSPAAARDDGSLEVQYEEGEVDREREFSREMDGLRIEDGRGPSAPGSSRGSSSPGGRRIPVMTGNRVFPVGPSGARIFNPDAYCQLCHREFCNKYFLKTHKANKHGVYDPDDASPPPTLPPPDAPPDQLERDMLTNQIRLLCAQNMAIQQLLHRGPMFPMPPFGPMGPMMPGFGPPMLHPPPEVKMEMPVDPPGDGVVCGVCNKRLSSQSFLRIHLKRKHGVEEAGRRPEAVEEKETVQTKKKKRGKRAEVKMEAGENAVPRDMRQGFEGAEPAGSVHLQRLLLSIREPPGGHNIRRETFRCPVCPTDFTSPYFLNCHLLKEHTHPSAPPTPEPCVLDLSVKSAPRPPAPSTPEAPASAPIDLESFCVKCNREYCSKYFLRTHLKKVHGMGQEEYLAEVQVTRPEVWRSFVSGEGATGTVEQPGVRRNWCKHCKKDFCNKYFFKTHMMKMHNEEVLELLTNSRSSRRRSQSVSCDICHKDLCSKYFLKIHRRNAHKISDPSLPADTPSEEGEGEVKDEDMEEDPSMPLSMAVSMAFQGPEGGRASVITCVGTHFVPPPEPEREEEEEEEAGWDMVVKEELHED